jgi:hypothetical protein
MHKNISGFTICIIILSLVRNVSGQTQWELKSDSLNLAVLVLDYQTYAFEQGHFSVHPLCDSCDIDSLPFNIQYHSPGDFGDITFFYNHTGDTLFSGTIIWMGGGKINYPDSFISGSVFEIDSTPAPSPASLQHYYFDMPVFSQGQADSVWEQVRYLRILKEFAVYPYRAGIYLYPPAVGAFDPSQAKWIVFVLRGNDWSSGKISYQPLQCEPVLFRSCPNPFASQVTFNLDIGNEVRVEIYDSQGQPAQTLYGYNRIAWNGMDQTGQVVPDGIYWLRISVEGSTFTRRIIKLER